MIPAFQDIREFILERNLTNVMNVARPSIKNQTLKFIREFILERNLTNVMIVARSLVRKYTLDIIRKFIQESSLRNVVKCGKIFHHRSTLTQHLRNEPGEEL